MSITSAIFNLNMGAIVCTKFCQSLSTDGPLNRGHVAKNVHHLKVGSLHVGHLEVMGEVFSTSHGVSGHTFRRMHETKQEPCSVDRSFKQLVAMK